MGGIQEWIVEEQAQRREIAFIITYIPKYESGFVPRYLIIMNPGFTYLIFNYGNKNLHKEVYVTHDVPYDSDIYLLPI